MLTARVGDSDLNVDPATAETVDVQISTSTGKITTLTLVEQGLNRGVFAAILPADYTDVPARSSVTMSYTDASSAGMGKTSSTMAQASPVPILSDVSITDLSVPESLLDGQSRNLMLSIANDKTAAAPATGEVLLTGTDGSEFRAAFTDLRVGGKLKLKFRWTARLANPATPETVEWRASIIVDSETVDGVDSDYITQVLVKKSGKNAKIK